MIQRSVSDLFSRLKSNGGKGFGCRVTYLEIHNEELDDLLSDLPIIGRGPVPPQARGKQRQKKLMLVEDANFGCVCHGLTKVEVTTASEVMALLAKGEKRSRVTETKMNKQSNRAHRIFTLYPQFECFEVMTKPFLTFIDLAGSEDIGRSGASGTTARESGNINKSLLSLGRVIDALAADEKHVPFRDSKLTQLLAETLGGACKTTFMACICKLFFFSKVSQVAARVYRGHHYINHFSSSIPLYFRSTFNDIKN